MLQPNKAGPGSRETVEEKKNYTDSPDTVTVDTAELPISRKYKDAVQTILTHLNKKTTT